MKSEFHEYRTMGNIKKIMGLQSNCRWLCAEGEKDEMQLRMETLSAGASAELDRLISDMLPYHTFTQY